MRDQERFRAVVRARRRAVGRTQQQLARAIGLHPDVLSHKINGTDSAVLTTQDVVGIMTVLAGWGALGSRTDAEELLALMAVPPHAVPAQAWATLPLAALPARGTPASAAAAVPGRRLQGGHEQDGRREPDEGGSRDAATDSNERRRRLTIAALPAPATELIGRERELAEVAAALASSRLVTLTGVGGTGKTRLAVQAGGELTGRFPDGVAFIEFAHVSDPALLATVIADSLGLAPPSADAAATQLAEALVDRELLLILDNLEQVLDGVALLPRLLAVAPKVRILATSRIALRLYGEYSLRVPPLPLPDTAQPLQPGAGGQRQRQSGNRPSAWRESPAVRLFIERARAVRPDFQPDDDDLADVVAICAVLDGLPLAIELAASRIRLYPPKALLPLLQARLALLTGGPRDLPQRQQTLRAALDWSYELLSPAEQRLFAFVGAFSGAFDAGAAATVTGERDPVAALDRLTDLADQSMLEVIWGETPRFQLLQTVREYALARLAEGGLYDQARRRHLDYYLGIASSAGRTGSPAGRAAHLRALWLVYPSIRTALEYACAQDEVTSGGDVADGTACLEAGMRLATAVCPLWRFRGPIAEGDRYLSRLLAVDDATGGRASGPVRAATVVQASALACFSGDYDRAAVLGREAVALYEPVGDHQGLATAHRFLGEALLALGQYQAADGHFSQSLAMAELAADARGQAATANMAGQLYRHLGDYARSGDVLRRAVRLFGALGDNESAAYCLHSLAETEREAGHVALAQRLFAIALRQHDELGSSRGIAYDFEGLASTAALSGQLDPALLYLGAARQVRDASGAHLPPVDQVRLDRILDQVLADRGQREQHHAFRRGYLQPVAATVAAALSRRP